MDTRSSGRIRRACTMLAAVVALAVMFTTPAFAADVAVADGGKMVGKETCAGCHADLAEKFDKTFHGRKSLSSAKLANACESCHGSGGAHADGGGDVSKIINPKKLDAAAAADMCLSCHKDKNLMMWKTGTHANNNVSCLKCHSIHEGDGSQSLVKGKTDTCLKCHKKQQADMRLASRHPVLEGKMSCVSCHNPHGGIQGNLKADSNEELCAKCHSEKVGPFAFEHPPVTDGCMNCHKPHGSQNDRLLNRPQPTLCMQCHKWPHQVRPNAAMGGAGTYNTPAVTLTHIQQRSRCTDCHREIHGSDRKASFKD